MRIWVSARVVPRWWLFGRKTVYFVNTETTTSGPYDSVYDALNLMNAIKHLDQMLEKICSGSSY